MMPKLMSDINGNMMPIAGLGASQDVDGTSASAASTVIDANHDSAVRISAVTTVRFLVGASPTAVATSVYLSSGMIDYVRVPAGQKIAVLGGKANIVVLA